MHGQLGLKRAKSSTYARDLSLRLAPETQGGGMIRTVMTTRQSDVHLYELVVTNGSGFPALPNTVPFVAIFANPIRAPMSIIRSPYITHDKTAAA